MAGIGHSHFRWIFLVGATNVNMLSLIALFRCQVTTILLHSGCTFFLPKHVGLGNRFFQLYHFDCKML